MEYPQDLYPLQTRANAIGYDITCFGNNEFVGPRQTPRMAQCGIILQQGDSMVDALNHEACCLRVIFSDDLSFLIEIF